MSLSGSEGIPLKKKLTEEPKGKGLAKVQKSQSIFRLVAGGHGES